ncbi:unnamed protein product [Moneuplotes crassus]|uniref:Uncharacterized protein n=1 Tax=Euplotes crassus TaxID=5936 RepID=A0AAD1UK68_EUPCR|nr:unnamed protein product [Moneuplotes crassus]
MINPISEMRNPIYLMNKIPQEKEILFMKSKPNRPISRKSFEDELQRVKEKFSAYNNGMPRNLRISDIPGATSKRKIRSNVNKSMDLSLKTSDLNQKSEIRIQKPYEYGEQYREVTKRKFIKRPRMSNTSLDLDISDIPGASVKFTNFNKKIRNILAVDDIEGAQSGTKSMQYPQRIARRKESRYSNDPITGGPKYGNIQLIRYESENLSSFLKSNKDAMEERAPITRHTKERLRTKRLFRNRYANLSNFTMDWEENITTKGYKHPLGKNHTALDVYLRGGLNSKKNDILALKTQNNLNNLSNTSQNQSKESVLQGRTKLMNSLELGNSGSTLCMNSKPPMKKFYDKFKSNKGQSTANECYMNLAHNTLKYPGIVKNNSRNRNNSLGALSSV